MNQVFKIVGVIGLLMLPIAGSAQSSQTWTTYSDLEKVKIDYTTQQCGEASATITEFEFIRLTNKTADPVSISFKIEYYYNGTCTTCGTNEYNFTFKLGPNASMMPDCTFGGDAGKLAIIKRYVNQNYGSPLDRFELTNIVVQ